MSTVATVPFTVLEQEYLTRKQKLDQLLDLREKSQMELESLDEQIDSLREPVEIKTDKKSLLKQAKKVAKIVSKDKPTAAGNRKSAADWAYGIINQFQRPMHVSELAKVLIQRGYKTVSDTPTFHCSLGSLLGKNDKFIRTAPNTFDIVGRHVDE